MNRPIRHPFPPAPAFILLEVLVSLTILGVSFSMLLRSFTVSLKAAAWSRDVSTAVVLGRNLVEDWEITPPPHGDSQGHFGDQYPRFSYDVRYEPEEIRYDELPGVHSLPALSKLRRVSVAIRVSPRRSIATAESVLLFETALIESDKFEPTARLMNSIPFE